MKKKLALLDLDGTLFGTNNVNYNAYKEAMIKLGYTLDYEYFCRECNGHSYKVFLPELTDGKPETLKIIHDDKKELYSEYLDKAIVNDHLFNILESLKNDYILAVVTTASKQNAYDILNYYNKTKLFDLVLTHDDVVNTKPDPEGFLKAIKHFDADPKDVIIFEDSSAGIEAARQTGATVFVVNTFRGDVNAK